MANHPVRINIQASRGAPAPSESDSESSDHGPPSESLDEDDVDASEASDDEAERAMDELLKLALPPAWERQLGRFRVRQQRQFVSPEDMARAIGATADRLGQARAESTWRVIAAVWNNFKVFNRENAVNPAWSALELDEKMATWVELKIGRGELSRTSPLTYVKKLEQIHRMLAGERSSLLMEYRRAVRRRVGAYARGRGPSRSRRLRTFWLPTYPRWPGARSSPCGSWPRGATTCSAFGSNT
jgi:hypothetical protein